MNEYIKPKLADLGILATNIEINAITNRSLPSVTHLLFSGVAIKIKINKIF